ncbi:hypothetical protein [Roseivirga sp.]|uniref:hypothetical protein n=1 Tax=Roseivirga sp. TaxID=1964215 RepID=UPI003B8B1E63
MKKINIYMIVLFGFVMTAATGCSNDDPMVNISQEEAFQRLSGQWGFGIDGSIAVDGTDVSANYPGFALSFSDGTYATTNGADLFDATGTWEWTDEQARSLRLNDGKEINIQTLTDNKFVFGFSLSGATRSGINGNYTVTVNK